jgi:hypothetical protein
MFADEVIQFLSTQEYKGSFPEGISVMNPLPDNPKIIPVEYPRYIMQYESKQKDFYINRYLDEFGKI